MDDGISNSLLSNLKIVLTARNIDGFGDEYLQYEIDRAISEINRCRRFTPDKKNKYDSKYEYLIIPMVVASISKVGAEGQTSHSENGVSRGYGSSGDYPRELLQEIIPLIK